MYDGGNINPAAFTIYRREVNETPWSPVPIPVTAPLGRPAFRTEPPIFALGRGQSRSAPVRQTILCRLAIL